jgi:hypothetical protein
MHNNWFATFFIDEKGENMSRVMPRRSMKMFTLLECIYELGGASYNDVLNEIGNISSRGTPSEMTKFFNSALDSGYVYMVGNKYKVLPDVAAHIDSVLKMEGNYKPKNLVQPAYRNIFTPELKGYETKLFRNKRGYENGFK